MGFVDYHGEKEDYYDDVVAYAKMQSETERRQLDEREKRIWIAGLMHTEELQSIDKKRIFDFVRSCL